MSSQILDEILISLNLEEHGHKQYIQKDKDVICFDVAHTTVQQILYQGSVSLV